MTLRNDLGTFEGFSFRHQCAIFPNLSAQDVIDWDHDNQGEAEFWPSGDHSGVRVTLGNKSSVTATEIKILDELINDLGDTTEAYAYSDESGHLFRFVSDTDPTISDSCRSEATLVGEQ